jgi:hypothetical protein
LISRSFLFYFAARCKQQNSWFPKDNATLATEKPADLDLASLATIEQVNFHIYRSATFTAEIARQRDSIVLGASELRGCPNLPL